MMAEMRLIDAAPLIEYFSGGDAAKSLAESISDQRFVEALKNAPVVDMGSTRLVGWVPVTERLPEAFVSVLVQMPGEKPFPTVREGFISNIGVWHSAYFDRGSDEVTHWMPMPEPPKE